VKLAHGLLAALHSLLHLRYLPLLRALQERRLGPVALAWHLRHGPQQQQKQQHQAYIAAAVAVLSSCKQVRALQASPRASLAPLMQCGPQGRQRQGQQRCSQAFLAALVLAWAWQALLLLLLLVAVGLASRLHRPRRHSSSSSHMLRLLDQQQQEAAASRHPCQVSGSLGVASHRRCLEVVC
jgi:hypothetical protein